MIKGTLILFIIFFYVISFFVWVYFFFKLLKKNPQNKKNIYLINISCFIAITYFVSFLILEVLN